MLTVCGRGVGRGRPGPLTSPRIAHERSRASSASASSRSATLSTFPTGSIGSASRTRMRLGTLKFTSRSRQNARREAGQRDGDLEHGGDLAPAGQAFGLDELEHALGIELLHEERGAAGDEHVRAHVAREADVVHGQVDEQPHRVGMPAVRLDPGTTDEPAVREHRALGPAGRARGVDDEGRVAGPDAGACRVERRAAHAGTQARQRRPRELAPVRSAS